MARDEDALKLIAADDKWAGSASSNDLAEPGNDGIGVTSRNAGFQEIYSRAEGEKPERELFNQLFRELSGAIIELNQRGSTLEWNTNISYEHPAIVSFGNEYYKSKQSNSGEQPTGVSDDYWEQIIITPATESDITGDPPRSAQRIVTPHSLPDATTRTRGLATGIATSGDINAGRNQNKYITPRALADSRYQRTTEENVVEPTSGNTISWNVGFAPVGNLTITDNRTLGAFSNPQDGGLYILRVRGGGDDGDTFTLTLDENSYQLGDRFQPENIPHNNTVLLGFMYINNRRYYIGELTGFNQ